MKENWATLETLRYNQDYILIIISHVRNFDGFGNTRTPYIIYDKLTPTKFFNLQQVVMWRWTIVSWLQPPRLQFFPPDQCRHDRLSAFMSLNCHDWQVHKLCLQWMSTVLNQQHHGYICLDFPCYPYHSGLPVFYQLLGFACLLTGPAYAMSWNWYVIIERHMQCC